MPRSGGDGDGAVRRTGRANHWRGGLADGGRLTLTDARLAFTPHRVNIQPVATSWPLAEIAGVERGSGPFTMLVALHDGSTERFVVYGRATWIAAIERARRGG